MISLFVCLFYPQIYLIPCLKGIPGCFQEVRPERLGSFTGSEEKYSSNEFLNTESKTGFQNFIDSFRRKQATEDESAGQQLAKGISKRHLILMSLVTGIGTGLFGWYRSGFA